MLFLGQRDWEPCGRPLEPHSCVFQETSLHMEPQEQGDEVKSPSSQLSDKSIINAAFTIDPCAIQLVLK